MRIPSGAAGGGWTECGSIDSIGHSLQIGLVHQLASEIEQIAERVATLLEAGWRRVRVVTDHGWLLLPGGLPKVELAPYLVETKWARCARVKGHPDLNFPVAAWYWNHRRADRVATRNRLFPRRRCLCARRHQPAGVRDPRA